MNGAVREYIEMRIPSPRFDIPRWQGSAVVAGVDTVNFDFGNIYKGVYIYGIVVANPGGIAAGTINNAQGVVLLHSNFGGTDSVAFEYVMFERRLILTSSVLTLTFSVGFQLITSHPKK